MRCESGNIFYTTRLLDAERLCMQEVKLCFKHTPPKAAHGHFVEIRQLLDDSAFASHET